MQVALDVTTLANAVHIAKIASGLDVGIIEIGEPLIKRYGMESVNHIRKIQPDIPILAEMASYDLIADNILLASKNGADIVLLIGINYRHQIEIAVHEARKNNIILILALPWHEIDLEWCKLVQDMGVDGVAILRNIDLSSEPSDIIERLHTVKDIIKKPIFISGGFTPYLIQKYIHESWNVVIVGRAIVDEVYPEESIKKILNVINKEYQDIA